MAPAQCPLSPFPVGGEGLPPGKSLGASLSLWVPLIPFSPKPSSVKAMLYTFCCLLVPWLKPTSALLFGLYLQAAKLKLF